ncbi:MAG: SDR family oxidoreductase, partial [Actinobacteria bacterium]|nr:SDR family oxidoreductase [Actinomycetota bacterium]
TGGGGGIGRATAIEMARQGARVVVSDVNDAGGEGTVAAIAGAGGTSVYRRCDMRSADEIEGLMAHAVATYGKLDVLHNNAGVHESVFTDRMTVQDVPLEVWDAVMDINLKGVFLAARAAYPHMKAVGGGSIVNAGSTASVLGFPMCPVYTTAKHGVAGLTKMMAIDFREANIRANCYAPASIDTAMVSKYYESAEDPELVKSYMAASHLNGRLGTAEEVAKLVCFLASDDASFINGVVYLIDGGALAWRGTVV